MVLLALVDKQYPTLDRNPRGQLPILLSPYKGITPADRLLVGTQYPLLDK